MDINTVTDFFMWCAVINIGLLMLWALSQLVFPDLVYRTQRRFFPIPRETFNVVFFSFLGVFKMD
jgi:hypothetical protein